MRQQKTVIKETELQELIGKVNQLRDVHGICYDFSVTKPLDESSYTLNHDEKPVFRGTKKAIYDFLTTFYKVISNIE